MNEENISSTRIRNLLANERTFLAWIRTSLGIMAFGFVVEKFALFIKKIGDLFSQEHLSEIAKAPAENGASHFGILLIGFGATIALLAFMQYHRVRKQIEEGSYRTHPSLAGILTLAIIGSGIFLIYYLKRS